MNTLIVSSKGQITVPKRLREELKLYAGAKIEATIDSEGRLVLTPALHTAETLFATRPPVSRVLTVEEMDAVIHARHRAST
ncbi:MAG: AbrB/MazE/SpoVT family DNA-binding domain-containing protein [Myxococcales bacterium]|nr:AbrB/MazE/SpoVT family DNA-binding domain-containing protein [Myxococcales bacterium]